MKRDSDKFHLMKVFQMVALKGSFTKAAYELSMTVSSVSKAVNQLETSLQTRLLHRTTRSQSLTDSGREYLLSAQRILGEFKDLEERLRQRGNEPSGRLRIAAPTGLGQFLIAPNIPEFARAHPKVQIDLVLNDRLTDITEEGFDLAIRSRNVPPTSSLYSCKAGVHTQRLVASADYLTQVSMPGNPQQLTDMALLNYTGTKAFALWTFNQGYKKISIEPKAIYTSNNNYALYQAALNGMGIANLYQYLVDDDIKSGRLVEILPQWQQRQRTLYAISQQRRDSS
ncbi:MAG: LysR family transcriptional regulator, partial [Psychrosphaera sp.]|nr:LysR family transcriptional regulator [Psychrosphaera sp.]